MLRLSPIVNPEYFQPESIADRVSYMPNSLTGNLRVETAPVMPPGAAAQSPCNELE